MKKTTVLLLALVTLLFSPSPILANDEVRQMYLDLKAKGFSQSVYVDELKSTDINFGPNDKYQLQLKITNAGNRNQTNVKVRQIIPSFITTDSPKEFTIPQIIAGESYIKNITVTVKGKENVNANLTRGQITFNTITEVGTNAQDSLAFYVGNGTYSPQIATTSANTLPKTGSQTLVFGTLISASILGLSLLLRRLARGY